LINLASNGHSLRRGDNHLLHEPLAVRFISED
jgi:hypothetical protein